MELAALNRLPEEEAARAFSRCCGASRWARAMTRGRPFADRKALLSGAAAAWEALGPEDWREAFSHHPRIGDREALRKRWAGQEQAGVQGASEEVLRGLEEGNREYEKRFGHVFLVCATGKSAAEMLSLLRERLSNPPGPELKVAAGEAAKITRIRLEKLLDEES